MHQIFATLLEAGIASLFLIPIFWKLNQTRFHNSCQTAFYTAFAIYLAGVWAVAGLPNLYYIRFSPHFNFIPFRYMFSALKSTVLNILLFVPLGFFLAVGWKPFRKIGWNLLFGFGTSFIIETLQIFTYRATDINDLMTNTLGCLAGYLPGMLIRRFLPSLWEEKPIKDLGIIFVSAAGVMFFLHPIVSPLVWGLLQ